MWTREVGYLPVTTMVGSYELVRIAIFNDHLELNTGLYCAGNILQYTNLTKPNLT